MLHNSSWSIEKHTSCPPAYMQLLSDDATQNSLSGASAPPLSNSVEALEASAHHQQQLDQLALPPGWEVLADSSGRPYYGNPTLKITQYQHPGVAPARSQSPFILQFQQPPAFQQPRANAAPFGVASAQASPWQRCTDAYGRRYILNTITGETQWEYGT